MGIKKWTDSINESSKFDSNIEFLRDALTTISDDWKVEVIKSKDFYNSIIVTITSDKQFIPMLDLSGQGRMSIQDIEDASKGMKNSSKIFDLFLEGLSRSGVIHDTLKVVVHQSTIKFRIGLMR